MSGSGNPGDSIPEWAWPLLACPLCKAALSRATDGLLCRACGPVGRIADGIARFSIAAPDASIRWYRDKGGTNFFARSDITYAMSSLDTPVYHSYLAALRPARKDAVVVDIGAGDGRNTALWLDWGFEYVIATDPVAASLERFRQRLQAEHPAWLDRILLVECDVRQLPLSCDSADVVVAIEVLYYLNEDYRLGLTECCRILKSQGRLLLSERSWEGALATRLLYGGIVEMLKLRGCRDMWDGVGDALVRSRCFTEAELLAIVREQGLIPLECKGVSLLSVVLGYLRGEGKLKPGDSQLLPQVNALLTELGANGKMRRTHVVVASKWRAPEV